MGTKTLTKLGEPFAPYAPTAWPLKCIPPVTHHVILPYERHTLNTRLCENHQLSILKVKLNTNATLNYRLYR
jgi:hypothetical protein